MPKEIHQVLEPYLQKIEDRLDPNQPYQPNAPLEQDLQKFIPSGPRNAADGWPLEISRPKFSSIGSPRLHDRWGGRL